MAVASAWIAENASIVVVLIDDMGIRDLSCCGNPDIRTVNIERLAAQGIRFRQFRVASPICSPSRVAILTGRYAARYMIHSYLNTRKRNREQGMRNCLDPSDRRLPGLVSRPDTQPCTSENGTPEAVETWITRSFPRATDSTGRSYPSKAGATEFFVLDASRNKARRSAKVRCVTSLDVK